ncbi:glycosyltransferase [Microbacterium sp. P01]|uniref:glycosyltransferase n=1 Tax=Microbacterium sp. P01 TaxID=3366261 RepID=UPI00366D2A06
MRVIFDILGSTERSGGMRLHATEIVNSWLNQFPEDDVLVVGGSWAKAEFEQVGARVSVLNNEKFVWRAWGQAVYTAWLRARTKADVLISLSPIVSPLAPSNRAICFQHDWRHIKNPHEFPVAQRAYRRMWKISAARAAVNVCISQKAAQETQSYVPGARTVVIENGWDHARSWPAFDHDSSDRYIVTFGHHNNKRPELLIDALSGLTDAGVRLVVLGARGQYRDELSERAERNGVAGRVVLPGFVEDEEYQRLVSGASVVALVSSDEGFGLPVAEAHYLGIPAVVTSDSGMESIFGDFPHVAEPDPNSLAHALNRALAAPQVAGPPEQSWDDTARQLRNLVGADPARGVRPSSSVMRL